MNTPRSAQEWVHWLELGPGARWIRRAALVLGVLLLSLLAGYKQFRGPATEVTLAQTVVARQLAAGEGFTTAVNYPQTVAVLRTRGFDTSTADALPELHQPPLYSLVIGGALRLLPANLQRSLFESVPVPPNGFAADYLLLVVNVLMLWLAAGLTYLIGRRLFETRVGLIAALGLLVSTTVWEQTAAVNGTPLPMVLLLALFYALVRLDPPEGDARGTALWQVLTGVACGLLFLCDYSAGAAFLPVLLYLGFRYKGKAARWALVRVFAGFVVIAAPWVARNISLTGNPLALAGQSVALRAGDPTAEPEIVRTTLSDLAPVLDLKKLGNKGLTGLQVALKERLWSGGGMLFTAFFVAGLLYRFRNPSVNRLRWLFVFVLASLVVATAFFDSGEGERFPAVYSVPLLCVFGAGFFVVLVASDERISGHLGLAGAVLVAAQAVPLFHDLAEPRRLHFSYPPYYPTLFAGMRDEMTRRGSPPWMADVPAGAAWYSGARVWAKPAKLLDFYAIGADHPIAALVLTPHTLDRPFFGELTRETGAEGHLGEWSRVYSGILTYRFPPGFPLTLPQKVSDNLYVLVDPLVAPLSGK